MGSTGEKRMLPTQSLNPGQDLQMTAKYANSGGWFHLREKKKNKETKIKGDEQCT